MPTIIRANETLTQSQAEIPLSVAAQAGSGQVALGRTVAQVGREFGASGRQISLAQQMGAAIQDFHRNFSTTRTKISRGVSEGLDRTTDANDEYIDELQRREAELVDKKGSPKYDSLVNDTQQIGNRIKQKTLRDIQDPVAAQEFDDNFSRAIENQSLTASTKANQQELDYGLQVLEKTLSKTIEQASKDSINQLATYEQTGLKALENALESGYISQEDYNSNLGKYSQDIRFTSIKNAIYNEREAASQLLQASPEELGLSKGTKADLDRTLLAAQKSDELDLQKAQERQRIDNYTAEASLVSEAESRIETDNMRPDELLELEGQITEKKFKSLVNKFEKAEDARAQMSLKMQEIGTRITEGQDLSTYTGREIDGYYDYIVDQFADKSETRVTLAEEAQLAASIPAPVQSFATKLENATLYGSTENAAETVAAYSYIKDRQKQTLVGNFDSKAYSVMEYAETLVEKGNVNPQSALQQARDAVFLADNEKRQTRAKEFLELDDFKIDNLEETAASALRSESLFGSNRITPEAVDTFQEFARQGYIDTGNKLAAISRAQTLMARTYGMSEISGSPVYMFQPPEMVYDNVPIETIRSALETETAGVLPPNAIPGSVSLQSDDATSQLVITGQVDGQPQTQKIPSWVVTYRTEVDGEELELPLVDPETGETLRWSALGSEFLEPSAKTHEELTESRTTTNIEEARATRQRFIEEQE